MQLQELMKDIPYRCLQGSIMQEVTGITECCGQVRAGMLFCCKKGHQMDGHKLAVQAVEQGAVALLVERPLLDVLPGVTVLQVEDTRRVWGHVSGAFYGHPARRMQLIGITGTKGKTTVSYMIRQMLQENGIPCGLIGTNGAFFQQRTWPVSHTTPIPEQLHEILYEMAEAGCQVVVMEASSIGCKEGRLEGLVFAYGIFTNFAPDHIGGTEHASMEEYFAWKKQLFWQCRRGILNGAEEKSGQLYAEIIQEIQQEHTESLQDVLKKDADGMPKLQQTHTEHMQEAQQGHLDCRRLTAPAQLEHIQEAQQGHLERMRERQPESASDRRGPVQWIWCRVEAPGISSLTPQKEETQAWYRAFGLQPIMDCLGIGMAFQVQDSEGMQWNGMIPLPGTYNVANAVCAIACVWDLWKQMHMDQTDGEQAGMKKKKQEQTEAKRFALEPFLQSLRRVRIPGRMELAGQWNGAWILVDYAHNASGLEQALMGVRPYVRGRLICVFGCGGNRSKVRRSQMGAVSDRFADWTIVTEDNSRDEAAEQIAADILQGISRLDRCRVILNRAEAIGAAIRMAQPEDMILIAGKGHETYQEKQGVRTRFSDQETVADWIAAQQLLP